MLDELILVTTMPHKSIGHAQTIMAKNKIKSLPIVNDEKEVKGIITSTDLLEDFSDNTPLSHVITTKVYAVSLSFVPLTNLGYGDITPVTSSSQSMALFLAVSGQLYLAIVIGILVGKFILFREK